MADSSVVRELRQRIARIEGRPYGPDDELVLKTGIEELDRALPFGGLPRGQIVEVAGAPGCGRTSLVLHTLRSVAAGGGLSALVEVHEPARADAAGIDAHALAAAGIAPGGVWRVRASAEQALWAADVLVRSSQFDCVVVDGAGAARTAELVRLQREARDTETLLVLLARTAWLEALAAPLAGVPGALRLELRTLSVAWEEGLLGPARPAAVHVGVRIEKHGVGEVMHSFTCPALEHLDRHVDPGDRRAAAGERLRRARK